MHKGRQRKIVTCMVGVPSSLSSGVHRYYSSKLLSIILAWLRGLRLAQTSLPIHDVILFSVVYYYILTYIAI